MYNEIIIIISILSQLEKHTRSETERVRIQGRFMEMAITPSITLYTCTLIPCQYSFQQYAPVDHLVKILLVHLIYLVPFPIS